MRMKRLNGGFTMIELMIVVSIIAILVSIAIPNLLRSRMSANEVSAVASLRSIGTAQAIFMRTDYAYSPWWQTDIVGTKEYAYPYWQLNAYQAPYNTPSSRINLISTELACAAYFAPSPQVGPQAPKAGYYYCDLGQDQTTVVNHLVKFGISASPAAYGLSGQNSFVMWNDGRIWQMDRGAAALPYVFIVHSDPTQWGYIAVE